MSTQIQLIIGLGNPGADYENTRHNAGAWFVEALARQQSIQLRPEAKFRGFYGQLTVNGQVCRLLFPNTFMNLSGQAAQAICRFYKIPPESILVAHDELDLPPGKARLKFEGGHGGHNGLRDIISHLNSKAFHRLRLGIGHPGNSKQAVDYVLKQPSKLEKTQLQQAIDDAVDVLPELVAGNIQQAMKTLHTYSLRR